MADDDLDFGETVKGFSAGQKMFKRYSLKKILGRGGMGVVWLAQDEELEREVALKFLPEVVAMDKQAVKDLKRETRRSLELTHPHIIRIYDFVQDTSAAAISMEFVSGATLAALKVDQANGHFEVSEIMAWVGQLCEALEYAHTRAEVVHRDLKPANLMVDARGELKVADFGIAASVSDSVSRVSVQAGSSGTPVYMSPQQMMGEPPAVTDDVYAIGSTLFELLTGRPPFYSGNVMMQVMNKVPPTMTARRQELGTNGEDIPEKWEAVIAACLAKEPTDRPRDVAAVLARLLGKTDHGSGESKTDQIDGVDVEIELRLLADEMASGGDFEVPVPLTHGVIRLRANIPAGISDGARVRYKGMGEPGQNGGRDGDLYATILLPKQEEVAESSSNSDPKVGRDLVLHLPFTLAERKAGGLYKIPVLRAGGKGTVKMQFPVEMDVGAKLRIRGEGEPGESGGKAGDLYLVIDDQTDSSIEASTPLKEKVEPKKEETLMGNILFWSFWAACAVGLVNWFGWLDTIEKPTLETWLVASGVEKNFSDTMDERSVNGFYRVKRALGALKLEGRSEEIPVNLRDRSFYSWGDVIEVQTNRWTGKTTTGAQQITFRLAAEIPGESYLVGEAGELALDLLMEVPVLEQNDDGEDTFRNDEVRWQESFPVKVVWKEKQPLTKRISQVLVMVLVGILGYAMLRAFCFGMTESPVVRGVLSTIMLVGLAGAGTKFHLDKAGEFDAARERERRLAFAEEAMAQNDLVMARDLAEQVLDAVPASSEARRILSMIDGMPVTLRVPEEYRSIQEAIDATKRNDIVEIAAGTYTEALVLKSDITLRGGGESADDVIIQLVNPPAEGGGNVLNIVGGVIGTVERLTLRHEGTLNADSRPPVVNVSERGARLTFTEVKILAGVGHGLFVGKGAEVQLYDVTISHCAWSGVLVDGSDGLNTSSKLVTGGLEDYTRITANRDHGVKVRAGGKAELQATYFTDNAVDGVRVEDKAIVEAENVALSNNGRYGLSVDGTGTQATVQNAVGSGNGTSVTSKTNGGSLSESGNDWN